MTQHREIETKFDVEPGVDLGEVVAGLPDHPSTRDLVTSVAGPVESSLEATYVDTADLDLARAGVTLRRRTGGGDAGWHLKLRTAADERLEVRRPLGRSVRTVPVALLDEVRPVVRDRPVAPVAVLATRRVEHRLLGADGTELAVLSDDSVRAATTGAAGSGEQTWREVEVELVAGDRDLLAAVGEALRSQGLRPSASASKLGRALGRPEPLSAPTSGLRPGTAGNALHAHLVALVQDLHAQDRPARGGDVDGVHDMRVTSRRLRTALAVHRPLLDRTETEALRAELHWLGSSLGGLRDVHVVDERITAALREQPPRLVRGPVRRRLAAEMRAREKAAATELRAALSSERYYRLLDALDDLLAETPYTAKADQPADEALPRLLRRTVRRVRRRRRAAAGGTGPAPDQRLHELRKAVRRSRYAAESAEPQVGRDARRLGRRMHALQDVLGEHQDSITAAALLGELAAAAESAEESSFTYGVLAGGEDGRGRAARDDYPRRLHKALAKRSTRWLG